MGSNMTYIATQSVPVSIVFGDGQKTTGKAGPGFVMKNVSQGELRIVGTWAGDPASVVEVLHRYFSQAFRKV